MTEAGALLHVVGNVNVDLIMGTLPAWPAIGTEAVLPHSELRLGGSAGNTALALKAIGARYNLVASRGNDVFGDWLAGELGEDAFPGAPVATPTTVSVGIVDPSGERTFLTSAGHLAAWSADDVALRLARDAKAGDIVLFAGSFLCPGIAAAEDELHRSLAARGVRIALDPGWPPDGWTDGTRSTVRRWLATTRCLLFNEVEATSLTGLSAVDDAARDLASMMPEDAIVVVKRGPDGADGWRRGRCHHAGAPKVRVIDTIGAGDIFNAGFLAALASGRDLDAALAAGTALASRAISTSPRRIG